ncbi:uncharacterized protein Z520_00134 [Fonsecaea multimorphosa CBS 102226]|uniref:Uncharacterized protein n=1 Tax=Fonsecaea multimorphosa CBS 102226 TaxID=1442371 RepID=A0A0D2KBM9_9EURO|nr:uncharacterized protein Z520_00134 [Fonsecaea multimorphosa CBS 102226]KIY03443.1 hypothetical protein Z520_00134 [Fonsecaea multimorphosa CBS 102226]
MRTVEALKAHAHTDYIDVYTEENLNHVIARSCRECQRKVMRVDGLVANGGEQCSLCLHKTTPISPLHCQQCDQLLKLCAHCVQYASKLHVHPIPRFNDAADRAEHGRMPRPTSTYATAGPQHSPVMQQSPRPSQGPFSPTASPKPPTQGYLGPAPARPPAGHSVPPTRQRISSTPPQALWSRPQSYHVPRPTRPNGAAQHQHQQQAFLDEVVSSIAVASITNAAVAAESNMIYGDGSNGSGTVGTAGTGTFDTGTAAADPTCMDATQDVSGVQITEWTTGQDTWQDTAVYDSGWELDDSGQFDSSF